MLEAIYASLSGTAQSPWLLCMYGFMEQRALWRNCRLKNLRPLFLLSGFVFFCVVGTLLKGGGRRCVGYYGSGGLVTLVLFLGLCLLRCSTWEVGLLMEICAGN